MYSTIPGGAYASWQGTSMAAPHVAGAIALIKQIHPDWKSDEIKAALMNNATILKNYQNGEVITWLLQGSGRMNIPAAVNTPSIVTPYNILMKVDSIKTVTLSIKNVLDSPQTFNISSEMTLGNSSAISVKLSSSSIVVDKGQTKTITVSFTVDKSKLEKGPQEGIIWLESESDKLHVPFILWNGDIDVPEKLYAVKASSNVINFGSTQSNKIDFDFSLGSGSVIPAVEPNERPESSNIIDEIEIRVTDLAGNALGTIYSKSLLLLGHYKFTWDGKDLYGNYFLTDGKYKWAVAAVESNNDQQNPVIQDSAKVEGEFEVSNAPKTKISIVIPKNTIAQEEVSAGSVKLETTNKIKDFVGSIYFDANLIKVETISLGGLIKQDDAEKYDYKIDNATGEIFFEIRMKEGKEITGTGNLVEMSFRGRIAGTSKIGFEESSLYAKENESILSVFLP
ncbi:MAG: S8 family serine peptidase, partial [Candidatus Kryptoniota bacterium]